MAKTRARISNAELEFLENNIAYALSIIRLAKAALFWIDDPDLIRIVSLIIAEAQELRTANINLMHTLKEQSQ